MLKHAVIRTFAILPSSTAIITTDPVTTASPVTPSPPVPRSPLSASSGSLSPFPPLLARLSLLPIPHDVPESRAAPSPDSLSPLKPPQWSPSAAAAAASGANRSSPKSQVPNQYLRGGPPVDSIADIGRQPEANPFLNQLGVPSAATTPDRVATEDHPPVHAAVIPQQNEGVHRTKIDPSRNSLSPFPPHPPALTNRFSPLPLDNPDQRRDTPSPDSLSPLMPPQWSVSGRHALSWTVRSSPTPPARPICAAESQRAKPPHDSIADIGRQPDGTQRRGGVPSAVPSVRDAVDRKSTPSFSSKKTAVPPQWPSCAPSGSLSPFSPPSPAKTAVRLSPLSVPRGIPETRATPSPDSLSPLKPPPSLPLAGAAAARGLSPRSAQRASASASQRGRPPLDTVVDIGRQPELNPFLATHLVAPSAHAASPSAGTPPGVSVHDVRRNTTDGQPVQAAVLPPSSMRVSAPMRSSGSPSCSLSPFQPVLPVATRQQSPNSPLHRLPSDVPDSPTTRFSSHSLSPLHSLCDVEIGLSINSPLKRRHTPPLGFRRSHTAPPPDSVADIGRQPQLNPFLLQPVATTSPGHPLATAPSPVQSVGTTSPPSDPPIVTDGHQSTTVSPASDSALSPVPAARDTSPNSAPTASPQQQVKARPQS